MQGMSNRLREDVARLAKWLRATAAEHKGTAVVVPVGLAGVLESLLTGEPLPESAIQELDAAHDEIAERIRGLKPIAVITPEVRWVAGEVSDG